MRTSNTNEGSLKLLSVCRVSSNEQSEGYSLDAQAQANREWAQRKGHRIVDTVQYVETASKQRDRHRFREILDRVRRDREISGVVFHKVDRACRNLADMALLERLETEANKKVFFSSQEFPQNAAGRLGVGVMGVAARWFTDNLREEVNKGFRAKVKAGDYPHTPPYGYRAGVDAQGRKLPVPDPQRAEVVRTAFRLMASGQYSLNTLCEELLCRGLFYRPAQRKWTRSHLGRVLHHPFYTGRILWRNREYPGRHEPLVDDRTWQQVQDVLAGRGQAKNHQRREFTYGHGLIRCAHCGHQITAEVHKQRYIYYHCAQMQYLEHPVRPAWVREPVIESQVTTLLGKLILPEEVRDWALAYLERAGRTDAADTRRQLQSLRRKASETQATLDALLLKAADVSDELGEHFLRLARGKQQELGLLQDRIGQLKTGTAGDSHKATEIIELAQRVAEQYVTLSPPKKRQIVHSVLSNLRLDDVTLLADYRLPFSILAENAACPLNYTRQDSNL